MRRREEIATLARIVCGEHRGDPQLDGKGDDDQLRVWARDVCRRAAAVAAQRRIAGRFTSVENHVRALESYAVMRSVVFAIKKSRRADILVDLRAHLCSFSTG